MHSTSKQVCLGLPALRRSSAGASRSRPCPPRPARASASFVGGSGGLHEQAASAAWLGQLLLCGVGLAAAAAWQEWGAEEAPKDEVRPQPTAAPAPPCPKPADSPPQGDVCPVCQGTGLTECACTRWSGDGEGCASCRGSGRSTCAACRGGGKGSRILLPLELRGACPPPALCGCGGRRRRPRGPCVLCVVSRPTEDEPVAAAASRLPARRPPFASPWLTLSPVRSVQAQGPVMNTGELHNITCFLDSTNAERLWRLARRLAPGGLAAHALPLGQPH